MNPNPDPKPSTPQIFVPTTFGDIKDGKVVIEFNTTDQAPVFDDRKIWTAKSGIWVPNEEKLNNRDVRYAPWVVGLKIQLTKSSMAWDTEVWFIRHPNPHDAAGLAHTLWRRQATLAWRKAGNTGPLPMYPDTIGRTSALCIDEGDWCEYYRSACSMVTTNPKFQLDALGDTVTDFGRGYPMFWSLRNFIFDFGYIFENDFEDGPNMAPFLL